MTVVPERLKRLAFRTWPRLPRWARKFLVHRGTPSFYVGALCVIERSDGALLLVRNSYRRGWGFPGGLLNRRETPIDAVRRETHEEIGVDVVLDDNPKVVVEPRTRRVDIIYTARPAADSDPRPRSPEILEARWFPATDLPGLMPEAVTALIALGRSQRPPADLP